MIARRLLDGLSDDGRVTVEFLPINPCLPRGFGWLKRIKYIRTVATSVVFVLSLLRAVPRTDVLHVFSASYYAYLIAALPPMLLGRVFGRPVLLNYHSGEALDHLERWPLSRWSMSALTDLIVVPSDYLVGIFARFGIHAEAIVNFVDTDLYSYRERRHVHPRVFSNRNLEPMYNVACSINAFSRIQKLHPKASLVIAGDGSERRLLEDLVAALGLSNVRFVGRISPLEMAALYDASDIYVNASNIDNMPLSIIEAFSAGLPVVSTNAGGIPVVVSHERNGLLVACENDVAIADAVLRYIDEPDFAFRIAAAARLECVDRYVWARVREEWIARYERLAS